MPILNNFLQVFFEKKDCILACRNKPKGTKYLNCLLNDSFLKLIRD